MSTLTLKPGVPVRLKLPRTPWQKCGGTIVDVWPDYEHPEESIVGVIFPRGGFVREENAFKAKDLLPFEYESL